MTEGAILPWTARVWCVELTYEAPDGKRHMYSHPMTRAEALVSAEEWKRDGHQAQMVIHLEAAQVWSAAQFKKATVKR